MSVLSFSEKVSESYVGKGLSLADSLGKGAFSFAQRALKASKSSWVCKRTGHLQTRLVLKHLTTVCTKTRCVPPGNVHSSMLKHCWSWYSSCDSANCTWEPHKGHPAFELSVRIYLGRGNLGFFICRVQEFELFPLTVAIICPVEDSFLWQKEWKNNGFRFLHFTGFHELEVL